MSLEKRQKYLEKIAQLFLRYGFKSVGVDDIAKELGVSKKTLYKEFKDKNEIVEETMRSFMEVEECEFEEYANNSENAIDEIIQMAKTITSRFEDLHPSVYFELQKYYPEAKRLFDEHKNDFIFGCIKQNMDRGVKEGLYRNNLNSSIIAGLFIHKAELFMDRTSFGDKRYPFHEVYLEMIRYHIRGVANDAGRTYLKERIKNETINI